MSVEFEQEQMLRNYMPASYGRSGDKGIVGWFINKKIAKNKNQANIIMILISVVSISLAIAWPTFIGTKNSGTSTKLYREDVEQSRVVILPSNRQTEFLQSLPSKTSL